MPIRIPNNKNESCNRDHTDTVSKTNNAQPLSRYALHTLSTTTLLTGALHHSIQLQTRKMLNQDLGGLNYKNFVSLTRGISNTWKATLFRNLGSINSRTIKDFTHEMLPAHHAPFAAVLSTSFMDTIFANYYSNKNIALGVVPPIQLNGNALQIATLAISSRYMRNILGTVGLMILLPEIKNLLDANSPKTDTRNFFLSAFGSALITSTFTTSLDKVQRYRVANVDTAMQAPGFFESFAQIYKAAGIKGLQQTYTWNVAFTLTALSIFYYTDYFFHRSQKHAEMTQVPADKPETPIERKNYPFTYYRGIDQSVIYKSLPNKEKISYHPKLLPQVSGFFNRYVPPSKPLDPKEVKRPTTSKP